MRERSPEWCAKPIAVGVCLLTAIAAQNVTAARAGVTEPIECGQVVNGELDPNDTDLGDGTWIESFDFALDRAATISVLMTGEGFAPYVLITDSENVTIQDGEPPQILTLEAGEYKVFANNLEVLPAASYPYALSLSCSNDEVEQIECGQIVAGQLEPSDTGFVLGTWIDPFDIVIDRPTQVRFDLLAEDFDPVVILRDSEGDDLGSGRFTYSTDLDSGAYTVLANNFVTRPDDVYPYLFSMSCTSLSCAGDCDGDGEVSVAELIRGVRIALGESDASCTAFDTDEDGEVTVNELVSAVRAALDGC